MTDSENVEVIDVMENSFNSCKSIAVFVLNNGQQAAKLNLDVAGAC